MRNQKLQCLLIGKSSVFFNLLRSLSALTVEIQLRQSPNIKTNIVASLQAMSGPTIIFVSDDAPFPLKQLSSLVTRYKPDAIVIIITTKTVSTSLKKPFGKTHFAKLNVKSNSVKVQVLLRNYAHIAKSKEQFRWCKSLLGNAERRNFWLVDSSHEAIAIISKDELLYSNTPFLVLFDLNTEKSLDGIRFRNFIAKDEVNIFNSFMKYQLKHQKLSHTLLLSMKANNGRNFRAKIYAIPSIFKDKFCWQLWVKEIKEVESEFSSRTSQISEDENAKLRMEMSKSSEKNPFDELTKELIEKKKKADADLVLKGIINRNEVSISAQKLLPVQSNSSNSCFVLSLNVPFSQKRSVDDLLFGSSEPDWSRNRDIFWDKAKVLRLIQILVKQKSLSNQYLVSLSTSSLSDSSFCKWMITNLALIGHQTKSLTFVFSVDSAVIDHHQLTEFVRLLKNKECGVAINEFTTDKNALDLLKLIKPSFVNLPTKWVKTIESNESKEVGLGRLIRQLEERRIQVIVPCGFGQEMKKIFVFSGASFCQERSTKRA